MPSKKLPVLTGNDIALLEQGAGLLVDFFAKTFKGTTMKRERVASAKAVMAKLSAISEHAYPYDPADAMPLDCGGEVLMVPDRASMRPTRREVRQRCRNY